MYRIKIKIWVTVVASGAMNLRNYTEWLNAIESKLKSTRPINIDDVAVVVRFVLLIPEKVTSTIRQASKVKSDRSFRARHIVLGRRQKHRIDCGTALFVSRFDLLVIASVCKENQYSRSSKCPVQLVSR